MPATENKDLLRHIFTELSQGNSRPFVEAMADDFTWTLTGASRWSRTFVGKKAVVTELFGALASAIDGNVKLAASRFVAEDDIVVVEARGAGNITKSGKSYDNTYCFVFRLENGRLKEVNEYLDTEMVTNILGQPPA